MTILSDIIAACTTPSVSGPDLLRMVHIAAHRLGATSIVEWARRELNGYDDTAALPSYRVLQTNVYGKFSGYFHTFMTHPLTAVPLGLEHKWIVELREPLLQIQAFSEAEGDLQRNWGIEDIKKYEESRVLYIEDHDLFDAWNSITTYSLRGVLDVVRTKALEFALELQSEFPDAGSEGGPTLSSVGEPLVQTVFNITNTIYGDGANVAAGHHISQKSKITKGDEAAFNREVQALGLSEEDALEFVALVAQEQNLEGHDTRRFLDRVRSGAVAVSGSLASNVAAGALVELGMSFLGLS